VSTALVPARAIRARGPVEQPNPHTVFFEMLSAATSNTFPQQHHRLDWLDKEIWPQIGTMMLHDAYFKLFGRAREITGQFNGAVASLIEMGYVTSQTVAIRRLCDKRRDVISLTRLLVEASGPNRQLIDPLLDQLDHCGHVVDLVNNYVAHTANPNGGRVVAQWNLQVGQLTEAQKAICEVALKFDRDVLRQQNRVKIIPVVQGDIMQDFRSWVPHDGIQKLFEFWHAHNDAVNAWCGTSL
jgi:hypothetical protein